MLAPPRCRYVIHLDSQSSTVGGPSEHHAPRAVWKVAFNSAAYVQDAPVLRGHAKCHLQSGTPSSLSLCTGGRAKTWPPSTSKRSAMGGVHVGCLNGSSMFVVSVTIVGLLGPGSIRLQRPRSKAWDSGSPCRRRFEPACNGPTYRLVCGCSAGGRHRDSALDGG